jgi:hypothetical protein
MDPSGGTMAGVTGGAFPRDPRAGCNDAFVEKLTPRTPEETVRALMAHVVALNLKQGISSSLDAKRVMVVAALDDLRDHNEVAAMIALQAFINSVEVQRGSRIGEADADALMADAQALISLLRK